MSVKLSKQPICVGCGKKIPKSTENMWCDSPGGLSMSHTRRVPICRSKADAQRHTNDRVVSITYSQDRDYMTGFPIGEPYVHKFTTWDGVSYQDAWFCGGTCRNTWAYQCAKRAWPQGHFGT